MYIQSLSAEHFAAYSAGTIGWGELPSKRKQQPAPKRVKMEAAAPLTTVTVTGRIVYRRVNPNGNLTFATIQPDGSSASSVASAGEGVNICWRRNGVAPSGMSASPEVWDKFGIQRNAGSSFPSQRSMLPKNALLELELLPVMRYVDTEDMDGDWRKLQFVMRWKVLEVERKAPKRRRAT